MLSPKFPVRCKKFLTPFFVKLTFCILSQMAWERCLGVVFPPPSGKAHDQGLNPIRFDDGCPHPPDKADKQNWVFQPAGSRACSKGLFAKIPSGAPAINTE